MTNNELLSENYSKKINLVGFIYLILIIFFIHFWPFSLPVEYISLCSSFAISFSFSSIPLFSDSFPSSSVLFSFPSSSRFPQRLSLSLPLQLHLCYRLNLCCYYQGIWLLWPLMSQQREEEGWRASENQRRSSNYLSLQMEVFLLLLWSAICLWSDSSTVWVWKQCQHWVINATKCFPNVARDEACG